MIQIMDGQRNNAVIARPKQQVSSARSGVLAGARS
jgi:hypothetical protein